MEFCPKCGSVILVTDGKARCAKCNYKPKGVFKVQSSKDIKKSEGVLVIDEKKLNTYPIVDMSCLKCKEKKAYFWILQTRSAGEPETKFYRCVKCEHTWREYR